jgi:hypothetical protein
MEFMNDFLEREAPAMKDFLNIISVSILSLASFYVGVLFQQRNKNDTTPSASLITLIYQLVSESLFTEN